MKEKFNCETSMVEEVEDAVTLCITEEERGVLADGILCLIHGVEEAKVLVHDANTLEALDGLVKKYRAVLEKIT